MKIFVDTAPFIYLMEEHPKYSKKLKKFFTNLYINEDKTITSVITYSEYGVKPERLKKQELIHEFEIFIEKLGIPLLEVKRIHAQKAYQLRARYPFLKGMDAIQLGTAITEKCDEFLTNDHKLETIEEIKVVLIDKLFNN